MTKLDNLAKSVILAAVAPREVARRNWYKAKSKKAVTDWPDSCARLLPEIYVNLMDESDQEILGMAKGVYRQSWTRNIKAFTKAGRFANALELNSINYRIIKGGAINLLKGKYGIRRMGDIDWIFFKEDGSKVVQILTEIGFRPRYEFPDNRLSEIWDDEAGNTFDIHLISSRNPLNMAFAGKEKITAFQADFHLPTPAALAIIAAEHATLGHAESDYSQGLVDVAFLAPKINRMELVKLLRRYGKAKRLRGFFSTLAELVPENFLFYAIEYPRDDFRSLQFKLQPKVKLKRKLFTPISLAQLKNSKKSMRFFAYVIWLSFGSIRPIERWWCKRFGGFLDEMRISAGFVGTLKLSPGNAFSSNSYLQVGQLTENELRFAFKKKAGAIVDLHLLAELEEPTPRMLFINGVGYGHFTPRKSNSLSLPLNPQAERIEISLRDFSHSNRPWRGHIEVKIEMIDR